MFFMRCFVYPRFTNEFMKIITLRCHAGHRFTAYFTSSAQLELQVQEVCCPICQSNSIAILPEFSEHAHLAQTQQHETNTIQLPNYHGEHLLERVLTHIASTRYPKISHSEEWVLNWLMQQIHALNYIPESEALNLLNRLNIENNDAEPFHLHLKLQNILQ